jgi:colanic acid/amylovoran biosynthesis glycosyltransferase
MSTEHPVSPIAYLVNQYPRVSHTFIRREIAALEALGQPVARFTLRPTREPQLDPADEAERHRTRAVLDAGAIGLLGATAATALGRPRAFATALAAAVRLGRRSERGLLRHLAYLAEACVLRRWLAEASVAHLHAHFATNSTTVALLCRLLGGPPYSFTAHGEEFDSPRALSLGEKVQHAAFAVGISSFGRSQLWRWADPADWAKVHVIHCAVDAEYFDAALEPIPDAPRFVNVGRLVPQKGQLLLIEAAARLRERGMPVELVFVGDGPMRGALEQATRRHGLEAAVRITGWASGADVRREIRAARALVLPSFAEGLPVVLMEALALGRPVVATYVAGIPELVRPGENGWLIPAGSVAALADAMAEVLTTPVSELERMGRSGAARVADRHDATAEAGKLLALVRHESNACRADERENLSAPDPDVTL